MNFCVQRVQVVIGSPDIKLSWIQWCVFAKDVAMTFLSSCRHDTFGLRSLVQTFGTVSNYLKALYKILDNAPKADLEIQHFDLDT